MDTVFSSASIEAAAVERRMCARVALAFTLSIGVWLMAETLVLPAGLASRA